MLAVLSEGALLSGALTIRLGSSLAAVSCAASEAATEICGDTALASVAALFLSADSLPAAVAPFQFFVFFHREIVGFQIGFHIGFGFRLGIGCQIEGQIRFRIGRLTVGSGFRNPLGTAFRLHFGFGFCLHFGFGL